MSQIEERNKIAREIHDNIGHTISGSLMQLEAIKGIVDKVSYNHWNIINSNLREALTNVLKYSKASKLRVKIHYIRGNSKELYN